MVQTLIILLAWIAWACFEGIREALYYHCKARYGWHVSYNEHILWMSQRICVAVMIITFAHPLVLLALVCMFPFFHDGMYYLARNEMDSNVYPMQWCADSTTSTAIVELKCWQRFALFLVGIIILVIWKLYV